MAKNVCVCVCVYVSVCVHTVPYLGSVGPSRTARPAARPEPALAISVPDSCFLYWGHSTAGGGPRKKNVREEHFKKSEESIQSLDG